MGIVVIDASIAVKWLFVEAGTSVANELLEGDSQFAAPSLIRFEVAGAASRRFRLREVSEAAARSACGRWNSLLHEHFIHIVPVDDLYEAALNLSFECKHALADCLYLATARLFKCRLLTADRAFYDRVRGVHPDTELLAKAA